MPDKVVKLSKTQQDLYDAMRGGVTCLYAPYMGNFNPSPYYFRSDNLKRCTVAAEALLKRGLVKTVSSSPRNKFLVVIVKEECNGEG